MDCLRVGRILGEWGCWLSGDLMGRQVVSRAADKAGYAIASACVLHLASQTLGSTKALDKAHVGSVEASTFSKIMG